MGLESGLQSSGTDVEGRTDGRMEGCWAAWSGQVCCHQSGAVAGLGEMPFLSLEGCECQGRAEAPCAEIPAAPTISLCRQLLFLRQSRSILSHCPNPPSVQPNKLLKGCGEPRDFINTGSTAGSPGNPGLLNSLRAPRGGSSGQATGVAGVWARSVLGRGPLS